MSDPGKRIHTLLTDRAIAGLSEREREELDALLGGESIDPSYEIAAAAIELSLLGHVEPLPDDVAATIVEQADRYWGFAELRPREPTLGGAGGELQLGNDTPIRRIWERSPDNLDDFVLESSLTNGRLDRIGPGESLRGEILPAAEEPLDEREDELQAERDSKFESEVDAQLDALAVDERDDDNDDDEDADDDEDDEDEQAPPEPVVARPRKRSRPQPRSEDRAPGESQLGASPVATPPDHKLAHWAAYISAVAALVILAIALWLYVERDDGVDLDELTVEIEAANDELEWSFAAKTDPAAGQGAGGSVLWSSDLQRGVITLRGLAANDPTTEQYQLWIVDRGRQGPPVDGGVFDVPVGEDELRLPVDAKLLVGDPAMFIITVEQPGGVVVSRQDRVVMVAAGG